MKKNLIVILTLSVFFSNCSNESVHIETKKINNMEFKNICFNVYESNYPVLKGMEDEEFASQINEIFKSNYEEFISKEKKNANCVDDYDISGLSASSHFNVLTLNSDFLSVVQYFITEYGGSGSSINSKVTNVDLKNRVVLNNSDFNMKGKKDIIDKQWSNYLKSLQPENSNLVEDHVVIPYSQSKVNYNKLKFGVRNDSVVLVIEAEPESHASYGTYIIPIEKWEKEN